MRIDLIGAHVCKAELAELSQRLRNIASDVRSLSQSEPDFVVRLQALHKQLDSVASRLRIVNDGEAVALSRAAVYDHGESQFQN